MEVTGDGSVDTAITSDFQNVTSVDTAITSDFQNPREWSSEKVGTFFRSLGTVVCFQSTGHQVLQVGVDVSVFFTLSLNDLQGVCGHARA
jgi:hypothetical protein